MSAPSSCCNPCATVETVEIPGVQGDAGEDGTNGTDGVNAYTATTDPFDTPAAGFNEDIAVANNSWMVIGQIIFIEGAGFYEVLSKSGLDGINAENLGYTGNAAGGVTIPSGSGISPGGSEPVISGFASDGANSDITSLSGLTTPLSVSQGGSGRAAPVAPLVAYATGTVYTLTAAFDPIVFGTTSPTFTFVTAGKYRISAVLSISQLAATFVASRQYQFRLVIGGAVVIPSSTSIQETGIQATTTAGRCMVLQEVIYDANAGDVLTIEGLVTVLPSAGSVAIAQCSIMAIPIPLY